jgi:hypothetical protein
VDQSDVVYVMDLVNNHSDLAKRVAALETKEGAGSASTNKPSAKPCSWCRGRIANTGSFANYCPMCGFDLRTASHVG